MANAPIFGTGYMEHNVATAPAHPPNQNEDTSKLDPAFAAAWNSAKYLVPSAWPGDNSRLGAYAVIAYRYKSGTGVYTPSISGISPTTTVHNVGFTLTVNGTNLDPGAKVHVTNPAGTSTTTLVPATSTPTQITAAVPGSAIPTAGTYTVSVRNLNGVVSTTTNLTVT